MSDFTLEQYQSLNNAIAVGALRVKYKDNEVTYRSQDEMLRLRDLMRDSLGLNAEQKHAPPQDRRAQQGPLMNLLDKTIGYFYPEAGAKRAFHRHAMSVMQQRYFEGASKTARTDGWRKPNTSPTAAMQGQLPTLRNASRNLTRNNPYAERALQVISSNVVGTGIKVRFRDPNKNETLEKQVTNLWWEWAHTTACDADGLQNFYGMQELAMRGVAEGGEMLIRRRRRRMTDGRVMPFQIQLLEPDFLDDTRDGELGNGHTVVQGVEFNRIGERVAYYLHETHPGDSSGMRSFKSNRIPARDIIHLFNPKRAGQVRGYPWIAPVLVRMQEFDQYEDAQLVKQRVSAAWCAFIRDMQPPAGATGVDKMAAADGSPSPDYFQPGIIETLPPGKDISFASPPAVTGYGEYSINVLRAISAGYGITYESMVNDYSNVNFSSGRMGWLEFQRNINSWQEKIIIGQMCVGVWRWFQEDAMLLGMETSKLETKWDRPRREMIDPQAEIKAAKDEVRSGFCSWSRKTSEMGYDPDEIMAEIAKDNAALDKHKITVEADARQPLSTKAGRPPGS